MTTSINTRAVRSTCQPKPVSLFARLRSFAAIGRQRRQLAALDAHILADIGVTATQARDEGAKAPWDVPDHWQH